METTPLQPSPPEVNKWRDVGITTEADLNHAADMYYRDEVGPEAWDQMPYDQRRSHLLDAMFGEDKWKMSVVEENPYPRYSRSGMYDVQQPVVLHVQKLVAPSPQQPI
jgi:hypothetical protein